MMKGLRLVASTRRPPAKLCSTTHRGNYSLAAALRVPAGTPAIMRAGRPLSHSLPRTKRNRRTRLCWAAHSLLRTKNALWERSLAVQAIRSDWCVVEPCRPRMQHLVTEQQQAIYKRTDRMFAGLMAIQWLAGIAAALWISPKTWAGSYSQTHIHVWAAVFLGGAISLFPIT